MRPRSVGAVAMCAAVLAIAACAGGHEATPGDGDATPSSADPQTSPVPPSSAAPPTTVPATGCPEPRDGHPADAGPYAVGRTAYRFVDTSRRTEPPADSGGAATSSRVIPVIVLYPAVGDPGGVGSFSDGADPAAGRFPMVVYSHGVGSSGEQRNDVLAAWARAGYVVIAPTFPLSSRGWDITDLPRQPGDVAFVVEALRSRAQNPADVLHDRVLTGCVALAGHSLGGATTLAAAFDPCCSSIAPRAVIDIAGVAVLVTPGASFAAAPPLPTLIVHGVGDATVGYEQSERAVDELTGPRWLVTFPGGGHNSMFEPPELDVLTPTVVQFLDAWLKGVPALSERITETVDRSNGLATLRVVDG